MILVTLKSNAPIEQRIMQLNPEAIESLNDLREGGCRVWLREKPDAIDVEESVNDIAIGLNAGIAEEYEMANSTIVIFERMARMLGWIALGLGAIGVAMIFLVVLR